MKCYLKYVFNKMFFVYWLVAFLVLVFIKYLGFWDECTRLGLLFASLVGSVLECTIEYFFKKIIGVI